jgi:hypothetical protein
MGDDIIHADTSLGIITKASHDLMDGLHKLAHDQTIPIDDDMSEFTFRVVFRHLKDLYATAEFRGFELGRRHNLRTVSQN